MHFFLRSELVRSDLVRQKSSVFPCFLLDLDLEIRSFLVRTLVRTLVRALVRALVRKVPFSFSDALLSHMII